MPTTASWTRAGPGACPRPRGARPGAAASACSAATLTRRRTASRSVPYGEILKWRRSRARRGRARLPSAPGPVRGAPRRCSAPAGCAAAPTATCACEHAASGQVERQPPRRQGQGRRRSASRSGVAAETRAPGGRCPARSARRRHRLERTAWRACPRPAARRTGRARTGPGTTDGRRGDAVEAIVVISKWFQWSGTPLPKREIVTSSGTTRS